MVPSVLRRTGQIQRVEHSPGRMLGMARDIDVNCDLGEMPEGSVEAEVFSAAQEKWLEVSSVSRFDTFQSNRLKLRFKDAQKKSHLCHTLNGSALALPRILAAILENNQTPDGITIPSVLQAYTGFDRIT
ncbi:MAG: hypothetical protein RL059_119 [Bacteroidota bacterium]